MKPTRNLFVATVVVALSGCGGSTPPDGANPNPDCHPLATTTCVMPWPSSYYQKVDATTKTGVRVAIPTGVLPAGFTGPMNPTRLNQRDGFSPATTMVAHFPAEVAPAQLVPETDPEKSLLANATTQVIDYDSGERVLLFAERDGNAARPEDQSLLIRPLVRLLPNHRYIVAVRDLVDPNGAKIAVPPFEALKSGKLTTASLKGEKDKYVDLFAKLAAAGIPKESLTLAWDFHTASDEQTYGNVIGMRNEAIPAWESENLGWHLEKTALSDDKLWIELVGTFDVPTYLTDDTDTAILKVDDTGKPIRRGTQSFPLVVHVPKCAETLTGAIPVFVYGHGLFGGAQEEMESDYHKQVKQALCMIQVGTDWIGLRAADETNVARDVVPDFTNLPQVTDRLQQAQLNFLVLAHLAKTKLASEPLLHIGDRVLLDPTHVYYYGVSQGGIEGASLLAMSPELERGVLGVGGGVYSFMLFRSVDFVGLKALLNLSYNSQRDQQILLALSQSYWDFTDPATFAPYLRKAPLPGLDGNALPAKPFILHEAIGDSQVPNIATRLMARTYGLPLMTPSIQSVPVLPTTAPGVDAAYVQWDIAATPLPALGNVPPNVDNLAHGRVRKLPQLVEQIRRFFKPDGKVEDTCGGACSFPGFTGQ